MATCHNMSTNGTQANTRIQIGHHTAGGNHPVACSFEDIPRYSNALSELQGIRPRVAQRRIAWQRASIKTSKHRQGWTIYEQINVWIIWIVCKILMFLRIYKSTWIKQKVKNTRTHAKQTGNVAAEICSKWTPPQMDKPMTSISPAALEKTKNEMNTFENGASFLLFLLLWFFQKKSGTSRARAPMRARSSSQSRPDGDDVMKYEDSCWNSHF